MARKKRNPKGETVGLKLTKAERNLLLDGLTGLPSAIERAIRDTPPSEPVMIARDDLDDLADRVAAEADGAEDKKIQAKLDVISRKIEDILDQYREPPEPGGAAGFAETILDLLAGEQPVFLPIPSKTKKGEEQYPITLTDKQREALIHATRLRRGLKDKIGQAPEGTQAVGFTRKELEVMVSEVDLAIDFAPSPYKKRLVAVLEKLEDLLDALQEKPVKPGSSPAKTSDQIYQLKITLKDIKPPVWRRVQVPDCTLGDLHEVTQIVMGWDDGHLHQFIVNGEYYGQRDPEGDDFGMEVEDEEGVLLSRIIKGDRKVRFKYEYDFGDGWQHEIQFERIVEREPKAQYPRCVDGARACPPEDVGGPWGYADFLEAMADPSHEQHEELREWVGDEFDPEEFSVERVNAELRQYLRGRSARD